MSQAALYQLILGLLIGGVIYYLSSLIPEATLANIVRFIGGLIILIVVVNFIFALLGFPSLVKIG